MSLMSCGGLMGEETSNRLETSLLNMLEGVLASLMRAYSLRSIWDTERGACRWRGEDDRGGSDVSSASPLKRPFLEASKPPASEVEVWFSRVSSPSPVCTIVDSASYSFPSRESMRIGGIGETPWAVSVSAVAVLPAGLALPLWSSLGKNPVLSFTSVMRGSGANVRPFSKPPPSRPILLDEGRLLPRMVALERVEVEENADVEDELDAMGRGITMVMGCGGCACCCCCTCCCR